MEDLFNTNITINGADIPFHVAFDHEKYIFTPSANAQSPGFSLSREHDEWQANDLPEDIKAQAAEALDMYLMRQH